MKTRYFIGVDWPQCSELIEMINHNLSVQGFEPIPLMIESDDFGFCLVCLNAKDEPILEMQLNYIFDLP